ncbi:MAG: ribonuclease III [Candidatus Kerfeldbacteria bacterium]|nr:ribonuclease III [Candidatus Kerfeldbacteria bacterium]
MNQDLSALEAKLSVTFTNKALLQQALVHRSYLNEHRDFGTGHNERLEFLGDAVLELVVTEYLYKNYTNPEGELTNWRAALVNATMCAEYANEIGLDPFLLMSRGELRDTNGKARTYILANAYEAVIGAVYLDQGYAASEKFVMPFVKEHLPRILEQKLYRDPKSRFQEESQEQLGVTPSYRVLEEAGPDHNKKFKVGVYLGSEFVAEGVGTSKQEAQVEAAIRALDVKGWGEKS